MHSTAAELGFTLTGYTPRGRVLVATDRPGNWSRLSELRHRLCGTLSCEPSPVTDVLPASVSAAAAHDSDLGQAEPFTPPPPRPDST